MEFLGDATSEVLMCIKSALFGLGFCQRGLERPVLPPLPPFAMATGLEA